MSKEKHTPGPWDENNGRVFRGNSGSICILTDQHSFGEYRANARLIAAAPELFKALKKLTMMARTSGGTAGPDAGLMEACAEAEAAIAKATGETEKLPQQ